MIEKNSPSRIIFNVINYSLMAAFALICIAPLWHVLMASVSNPRMLVASSGLLWKPQGEITFKGYELVFRNGSLMGGYLNTIIYVVWHAVVGTLFTLLAGYLVSRKNFKLQLPLLLFILFTMMFSGGLIPTYQVQRSIGLINNKWALMIPGMMNAFYITMIKAAFDQLSPSFEESAKLDGAGPITILFRILTPLIKPSLAVVVMFTVVMQWNSWYPASIYLPMARKDWPLQLLMREILVQNNTAKIISGADAAAKADLTSNLVKYCVSIVGTLPILCAYPFAQKYFVKGATMGGVKG